MGMTGAERDHARRPLSEHRIEEISHLDLVFEVRPMPSDRVDTTVECVAAPATFPKPGRLTNVGIYEAPAQRVRDQTSRHRLADTGWPAQDDTLLNRGQHY